MSSRDKDKFSSFRDSISQTINSLIPEMNDIDIEKRVQSVVVDRLLMATPKELDFMRHSLDIKSTTSIYELAEEYNWEASNPIAHLVRKTTPFKESLRYLYVLGDVLKEVEPSSWKTTISRLLDWSQTKLPSIPDYRKESALIRELEEFIIEKIIAVRQANPEKPPSGKLVSATLQLIMIRRRVEAEKEMLTI